MRYLYMGILLLATSGCASSNYYIHEGKKEPLTPVKERSNSDLDMYVTKNGKKVGVSDTLLVKFLNTNNLSYYIQKYNIVQSRQILPNLYEFKVQDKSLTIQTANDLSSQSDIKYAHPNFVKKRVKR